MTRADRRRILILVIIYGTILAGWLAFARWAAPAIITRTGQGSETSILSRLVRDQRFLSPMARTPLQFWRHLSDAVLIAGLLHLAVVLYICLPGTTNAKQDSPRRKMDRWATPVLIVLSLVYLAATVSRGCIQDYYFYLQMWKEIELGHDPWFYAFGVFGKYPMNAYGPLFNVFAIPELINPLFPKLLFATAYLGFAIWLTKDSIQDTSGRSLPWPLLVAWFWMPYCWVEIANFGHFGIDCRPALRGGRQGACPPARRNLRSLPWCRLAAQVHAGRDAAFSCARWAAAAPSPGGRRDHDNRAGTGGQALIWGPSTFRPLIFAAERSSHHLSIFRFLKGPYSPLRRLDIVDDLDPAAPFFMLIALSWTWLQAQKRMIQPAPAAVLAILVTLMFYQVGFAQYHMVLFVLASYWMVSHPAADS